MLPVTALETERVFTPRELLIEPVKTAAGVVVDIVTGAVAEPTVWGEGAIVHDVGEICDTIVVWAATPDPLRIAFGLITTVVEVDPPFKLIGVMGPGM